MNVSVYTLVSQLHDPVATRRDGKGDTYTNTGEEVILDQDITLYAIWNKN